jgi:hypothetical protein
MIARRLRFRDLVTLGIVKNRATLRNRIRNNNFPPGELTGPNERTWGEDVIQDYIDSCPQAPRPVPPSGGGRRGRRKASVPTAERAP